MNNQSRKFVALLAMGIAPAIFAQQSKPTAGRPFQAKSSSNITFNVKGGAETIEITNVTYEVAGPGIPGRPSAERLVLRKTLRSKEVADEIDIEASSTIEAWPLGVDPRQKPLYSMTMPGVDVKTLNGELLAISRGVAEVEWWSVHKIGTGEHLFDTYVPVVQFSISRDVRTLRYVGLEVPPDDTSDGRLKAPNVVGVLTYASAEGVIQEVLITCNPKLASSLRSFADATRTVAVVEHEPPATAGKTTKEPARAVRISISQSYPAPPATVTITIPIGKDDLDLTRLQAPAGVHVVAWKR